LLLLAQEVHARGYKVVLTGEGADETLAGYPWFKVQRLLGLLDALPGLRLGRWARRTFFRWVGGSDFDPGAMRRAEEAVGGHTAWHDLYGLVSLAKRQFYGERLRELEEFEPYAGLGLDPVRLRRWHPLNQSLAVGQRTHLAGLLLSLGGDRVAMHSSVETRYPFLDEDLADFAAGLAPNLKLRGLREKYLMRLAAERWLPRSIAWRPKTMFQAPFDLFCRRPAPGYVAQLLSPESLAATGYFDAARVRHWLGAVSGLRPGSARRFVIELGLAAVTATQLWHHTFIEARLADLPSLADSPAPGAAPVSG
jgi:asparagine synthase (glutamine-hydrolysing)